jgi:hypothetical protein
MFPDPEIAVGQGQLELCAMYTQSTRLPIRPPNFGYVDSVEPAVETWR